MSTNNTEPTSSRNVVQMLVRIIAVVSLIGFGSVGFLHAQLKDKHSSTLKELAKGRGKADTLEIELKGTRADHDAVILDKSNLEMSLYDEKRKLLEARRRLAALENAAK